MPVSFCFVVFDVVGGIGTNPVPVCERISVFDALLRDCVNVGGGGGRMSTGFSALEIFEEGT